MPWLALVVLLTLAGALARQPLPVAAALVIGAGTLLAPAWARASLRGVTYRRRLEPSRVFPGEPVQVTIQLENDKLLPVSWLQVEEQNPREAVWEQGRLGPHHLPRRQVLLQFLSLGWFQRVTRHYRVRVAERGYYEFGPVRLQAGDVFGLATAETELPGVEPLVVCPRLLDPLQLAALWRTAGGDRAVQQSLQTDPTRLLGVREYRPGDPWRQVHWKASARLGTLQTKLFEPAVVPGTAIFLDLRTYPNAWDGYHPGRLEAAITLAASLFHAEVTERRRAALFANGFMARWGQGPAQLLTADPAALSAVLEALGRLLPWAVGGLAPAVEGALGHLPQGTQLTVIASLATPELPVLLGDLRRRGYPITLLWLGEEAAPEPPEGVELRSLDWREVV